MYVFGSLSTSEGAPPLVTVKIYMSSVFYSSNDMSVSVITVFNIRTVLQKYHSF